MRLRRSRSGPTLTYFYRLSSLLFLGALFSPGAAHAALAECRGMRLEDVASGGCELRGGASCEGGCTRLGIYEKACATELHTVCRQECTVSADATCTDGCTETCTSECDRGVSITCIHNCFGECVGSCDAHCEGSTDPSQCRATCEATCDGECDIQCRPVVDGDCYTHCVECCGGSCKAQANLDCQTTCQQEEFESCEHELEVECSGSCDVDVALFCEGQYVMSGPDLQVCVEALVTQGSLELNAEAEATLDAGTLDTHTKAGCAMAPTAGSLAEGLGSGCLGAALALLLRRRRVR